MKGINTEDKIRTKYEQSMHKSEDALVAIRNRKKDLERQEGNFHITKKHLFRYCEEQRERYAGTDDMIRYNRMENDIHELTTLSRTLLDKEYEEIKKEEKRLYQQQEKYYQEYLSEMRSYHNKENT